MVKRTGYAARRTHIRDVTYLCPCCPHSLGFLSLCPVSVLSWRQKIGIYEQGELGFSFPSGRVSKAVTNNWLLLPAAGRPSSTPQALIPWAKGTLTPPYGLPPATLGPVGSGGGHHAGMVAGVPATVGVPGQDAVVAGAVAGAAGQ